MVRGDMSELMGRHIVAKLIGSSPSVVSVTLVPAYQSLLAQSMPASHSEWQRGGQGATE